MTFRTSIEGLQTWFNTNYANVVTFTERMPATDDPIQLVIHLDDEQPWRWIEPGKSRIVNLVLAFRFELSQYDSTFIEADANDMVSEIEYALITEPIAGLRLQPDKVRSYFIDSGRFMVVLNLTARINEGE